MIKNLLNLLYPAKCFVCENIFQAEEQNIVCKDCINKISPSEVFYCKSCGAPTENCQKCLKKRKYEYIKVFTSADEKLIDIIALYKLQRVKPLGKEIANRISEDISEFVKKENIDLITYIPLSKRVYRERGFNHLEFILKNIFPLYMVKNVLLKNRETKLQMSLSAEERKRNIKGAFSLNPDVDLKNKNVLVFDDILTTGSTMLEAYKTIKKGNPKKIFGYVICR